MLGLHAEEFYETLVYIRLQDVHAEQFFWVIVLCGAASSGSLSLTGHFFYFIHLIASRQNTLASGFWPWMSNEHCNAPESEAQPHVLKLNLMSCPGLLSSAAYHMSAWFHSLS